MTNKEQFKSILDHMNYVYLKKNHDYGNSFDEQMDEDGPIYLKGKLGDKYSRFKTLIKNPAEVKDESLVDTLLDMANYCVLGIMWLNNRATNIEKGIREPSEKE